MDNAIDILLEKRHELWLSWKELPVPVNTKQYDWDDKIRTKNAARLIIDELDYAVKALLEKKDQYYTNDYKSCQ